MGAGPNDLGSSRFHIIEQVDASLRRLGTDRIDIYHMHGFDALTPVEETLDTLNTLVHSGKDPLHCLLQLLRLAPHEVARHLRPPWLDALRRTPGLLLPHRPRLRVGTDAPRARSGRRRAHLEPARMGTPHREDPPRPATARRQPPAQSRGMSAPRSTTSTFTTSSTPSTQWRR